MFDVISDDSLSQHMQVLFILKLCGVTAHEGHLRQITEESLKTVHFGKHMDAIDAAARPEIDHDELALELVLE